MSNLWGSYADSKPVLKYSNRGQAALLSVQLYRDRTQVLMYISRTDPSTVCALQISVDIVKLYCMLDKTMCVFPNNKKTPYSIDAQCNKDDNKIHKYIHSK